MTATAKLGLLTRLAALGLGAALGAMVFAAGGSASATPVAAGQAAHTLQAKAQAGQAWSQMMLGLEYRDGVDVAPDMAQAVVWFRKAADQGFAPDMQMMGSLYADGAAVPRDDAQAFK